MYANGTGIAFRTFTGTIKRLNAGFRERIRWMKPSEIARYWAAKELTAIDNANGKTTLKAPFATPGFTLALPSHTSAPVVQHGDSRTELQKVSSTQQLSDGTWTRAGIQGHTVVCFQLEKGTTTIS